MLSRRYAYLLSWMTICLPVSSLSAQETSNVKLQRDFDSAFSDVLRDPANLEASFNHAELAIRLGDFEAAISSLERMLLYNPDLPRVRLELGVLYFRLGSYAVARNYLTSAVRGAEVPAEVKARVAEFLREIDRRTQRHSFSGSVFGGFRYQTNANAGPERPAVSVFGFSLPLDSESTRNDDINLFLAGNLKYVYDPQLESGDVLETQLLGYMTQQSHEQDYDLVYIDASVGPRGRFMPDVFEYVTWRPHITLTHVALAESSYYQAYGAGLTFDKQFSPAATGSIEFNTEDRHYRADAERTTARLNSGHVSEVSGKLQYLVNRSLRVGGKMEYSQTAAEVSFNSNRKFTVGVNASVNYDAPISFGVETWNTSFDTSVSDVAYRAADPTVDPNRKRRDREVRFTATTTIPIDKRWALSATFERTRAGSNLLNYDYTNTAFSVGASLRF
jgi:hypothetical protein